MINKNDKIAFNFDVFNDVLLHLFNNHTFKMMINNEICYFILLEADERLKSAAELLAQHKDEPQTSAKEEGCSI